jgi:hypothetical protein
VGFFIAHDGVALDNGRLLHAVTLYDDQVPLWLPRPLDASTSIMQWNLYVSRAGEDPESTRLALSPRPPMDDMVPMVLLGVFVLWVLVAPRRRTG